MTPCYEIPWSLVTTNSTQCCAVLPSSILTEQLVCPAVERLAGCSILVLLVVLNGSEVSQGPHEAPEVYLVLSKAKQNTDKRNDMRTEFTLTSWIWNRHKINYHRFFCAGSGYHYPQIKQ